MTTDHAETTGTIGGTVVNNNPIQSNKDITFQFELEFKTTNPAGERVLFEFGGGNGTGASLVYSDFADALRFQS